MTPADSTYIVMSRALAEARDDGEKAAHNHALCVIWGAWLATDDQRFRDLYNDERALAEEAFGGLPNKRTA